MSRKHFCAIAGAIREIGDNAARRIAALALADCLRGTNPRFDRGRFLYACNVEE